MPALTAAAASVPAPVPACVALINDHGAIALVSNGSLVTFDLVSARLLAAVPACVGVEYPVACAYQPFVFATASAPAAAAPNASL